VAATFSVVFASLMALVAVCWGGYHLTRVFAEAFKCRKELLKASLDAGGYRAGDFLRLCFALSVVALVVLFAAGVWSVLPVLAGAAVAVILSLGIVEAAKKRLL